MKNLLNITLTITLMVVILFSCAKDPIEASGECMNYTDIHSIANDARFMFFIDDKEGWMISNESFYVAESGNAILLHTIDAGQTWNVINNDLKFGQLSMFGNASSFKFQFFDNNNGYIALHLLGMDGFTENDFYYYTTDKGVTWDAITLPTELVDVSDNYGMGVNSTQMVFAMRAEHIGENTTYKRLYFVSNTSHAVTSYVLLPEDYNFRPYDIHFSETGNINMLVTKGSQYYMAHSKDSGNSWTYSPIEYETVSYSYMDFPTDNVGYLPVHTNTHEENQPFYKTTDGGKTWIKKTPTSSNGLNYNHFSFIDENNGLATKFLGDELFKTTNGGDTWNRVSCFLEKNSSLDIRTHPKSVSYLSKDNGVILTKWDNLDYEDINDAFQNRVYYYKGE